ncbi:Rrf2 family transcriptional regulator, iron-sulfur cluster assembly transcription factor [Thermotomaculum hydrothermale]|uniref:Rrf2 family transcriptional regulator, iron-sulfur cluster assembly transcription factor n=1 Tax=Thermotomaculum hydrothermale TaxID=981385 RepID=A0A7R6PJD4_9BACT|nr:Rrf2 family transcriptional regulator [Thermotomaculum hydrothermale]BBB33639.1 Rrf2 family transcriptional regulator, iron-sulfur cluster assembly transcription factor [Thermotomaculum hydrothermale]
MKLSLLQTHGLKILLTIIKSGKETLTASEISKIEGLKTGYVGKILFMLRKAGIVSTIRGKTGGYFLADDKKNITLYDVLNALTPNKTEIDLCPNIKEGEDCTHSIDCAIRPVFYEAHQYFKYLAQSITLEEMANREKDIMSKVLKIKDQYYEKRRNHEKVFRG